jgi:hypothetical protein
MEAAGAAREAGADMAFAQWIDRPWCKTHPDDSPFASPGVGALCWRLAYRVQVGTLRLKINWSTCRQKKQSRQQKALPNPFLIRLMPNRPGLAVGHLAMPKIISIMIAPVGQQYTSTTSQYSLALSAEIFCESSAFEECNAPVSEYCRQLGYKCPIAHVQVVS